MRIYVLHHRLYLCRHLRNCYHDSHQGRKRPGTARSIQVQYPITAGVKDGPEHSAAAATAYKRLLCTRSVAALQPLSSSGHAQFGAT